MSIDQSCRCNRDRESQICANREVTRLVPRPTGAPFSTFPITRETVLSNALSALCAWGAKHLNAAHSGT